MPYYDYAQLNGKKYKIQADGWEPSYGRFRSVSVGLTGKTIITDLTPTNRAPVSWKMTFKTFINDPEPDSTWGTFSDILAAMAASTVTFVEHDGTTHTVVIPNDVVPKARVPAAAYTGECNEVYYIDLQLVKVYQ